jgi:REP element-mobilizing transposase RayT
MAHTYVCGLYHCVFSTKNRCALIPPAKQPRLWSYFCGIARKNGFKLIAAGGIANHAHLLVSLPPTIPLCKAIQLIKGGSSKWMNDTGSGRFEWQGGYSAFSIGVSQQSHTIAYINDQTRHHHKVSFEEELLAFMAKHGIKDDPKSIFE